MIKRKITKCCFQYNHVYTISIFGFVVYCVQLTGVDRDQMVEIFGEKLVRKIK